MRPLHEALAADGFAVLREVLPLSTIDAHLAAVGPPTAAKLDEIRRSEHVDPAASDASVYRAHPRPVLTAAKAACERSEPSQELFFDRALRDFAAGWFGAEPVFCHGSTVLYPTGAAPGEASLPHADYTSAAAPDPWTCGLRFWCALEDIADEVGPLEIWRGSHRAVTATVQEDTLNRSPAIAAAMREQLDMTGEDWRPALDMAREASRRLMADGCLSLGLEARRFAVRKGDVVVFNPATVHQAAVCANDRLTRKIMIFDLCHPAASWYSPRAWWGPLHDYRSPANEMAVEVERGPLGPRWRNYPAAFADAMARPVAH